MKWYNFAMGRRIATLLIVITASILVLRKLDTGKHFNAHYKINVSKQGLAKTCYLPTDQQNPRYMQTFCETLLKVTISESSGLPCDLKPWETPRTLLSPFSGLFKYVKFTVMQPTDIQRNVVSSSECTAATCLASIQTLMNN